MINKLWTGVSLENYNNWYPLTGKITETPQQYIKTWPNVNDWFKTFAIRAQNDINAYLDFILSKFPFDSFKDELIKETLRDMVYVCAEHWVFNRTPIEFNVDATIQFNNGSQFSANSTPTINVWDLAPSRMKILARLTELKQIFSSYNDDEIDVEKIDLKAFYTRTQVDELIEQQKEFTLSKQIKLYDDVVNDNEHEVFRGAVTNFINKGYVATEYNKETETMILNWPNEIGTLPPEALQNNPQIGDFTHAATADFSAKQQKRITINENTINQISNYIFKNRDDILDIKNNWFNIETSPLWKKVENNNIEIFKWYFIKISYHYSNENNFMKFYKVIKIYLNNVFNEFELLNVDSMTYEEQIQNKNILNIGTIYYNNKNKKFNGGGSCYPECGKINLIGDIEEIYQYIGTGIPTEFIAEEGTERDYYTKQETNELLDKKQNINDDNLQATVKQIVPAINENKLNINKKQDKLIAGENIKIENNVISATGGKTDLSDYYKKEEVDKKLEDKMDKDQFQYAFTVNALGTEIPNLETTKKTIVGAINELNKKINDDWQPVGSSRDNRSWLYNLKTDVYYKVKFNWNLPNKNNGYLEQFFKYSGNPMTLMTFQSDSIGLINVPEVLNITASSSGVFIKVFQKGSATTNFGNIIGLEEKITNSLYKMKSLSPSIPQWKEVGTREKNKWDNWQITYDFIKNKRYRVYYSWNIYNPVFAIQEFIITDDRIAGVEIEVFNNNTAILVLSVNHAKFITIYSLKGNVKGNTWKLEELQE